MNEIIAILCCHYAQNNLIYKYELKLIINHLELFV